MKIEQSDLPKNLLCFSHLRWDFVFQRPQHLMSRFAKEMNVYFFEEPIYDAIDKPFIHFSERNEHLTVLIPYLPHGISQVEEKEFMKTLLQEFLGEKNLSKWIFWYYTPMALCFSAQCSPAITIFDCMDELSAFDFAPPELVAMEAALLKTADVVFTGGHSIHEAKCDQHNNIHVFPSSIDKKHFYQTRTCNTEPDVQKNIDGIKLGFVGVIDERFDTKLIRDLAQKRPEWQIILLGPIVKVSFDTLPTGPNIHYLGQKSYDNLPLYLSGWNVALIPFAINNSTKFISPTKTPEYLAAGCRVVSTPIRDVVKPYGVEGLVDIARDSDEFITAIEAAISAKDRASWLAKVDLFLKDKSWDNTYELMKKEMVRTFLEADKLLAS